jgi:hypothetical protein
MTHGTPPERDVGGAESINITLRSEGIYMKINYFNADHTHALIDLPTCYSIELTLFRSR